jgi:hypothetical protein
MVDILEYPLTDVAEALCEGFHPMTALVEDLGYTPPRLFNEIRYVRAGVFYKTYFDTSG